MPDLVDSGAALIFSRLDVNGDGVVSAAERRSVSAPLAELVVHADRNHDGLTTNPELTAEMKLGAERDQQSKRAMRFVQ
jgi:hypothetical protein